MPKTKSLTAGCSRLIGWENEMFRKFYFTKCLQAITFGFALTIVTDSFGLQQLRAMRLKDISNVLGVRENQLLGYGLVVGLNGTGDSSSSTFTMQSIATMMTQMGVPTRPEDVNVKNTAAVLVTATLKPFSKIGDRLDLTLSSLADATSLAGGILIRTPLRAANQQVYAVAQGPLSVGGLGGSGHNTVARLPQGALIEQNITSNFIHGGKIVFNLREPDFTTAARVAKAVNLQLGGFFAEAKNSSTVHVQVPEYYKSDLVRLFAILENVNVKTDRRAVIVVNERTGTIVMGDHVKISTVAISHGDLSVEVKTEIAEEEESKKKESEEENEELEIKQHRVNIVQQGTDIGVLVRGLNELGVKPNDLIIILQTLKAAGALNADLKFI